MDVPALVDRLTTLLAADPSVVTAYLFGSAATGAPVPRDLDVAVVVTDPTTDRQVRELQARVESELEVDVDLHALDDLPVDVQHRAVVEGRVLVDRDRATRVEREVRTFFAAEDLRPYLELLRAAARERILSRG